MTDGSKRKVRRACLHDADPSDEWVVSPAGRLALGEALERPDPHGP